MFTKDILLIDTETTGLNVETAEVHQLGAVLIDRKTFDIIDEFNLDCAIIHPEFAQQGALQLNHLTTDELVNRPVSQSDCISLFLSHFFNKKNKREYKDVHLASWNTVFDVSLIRKMLFNANMSEVYSQFDHHHIDLWTLFATFRGMLGKDDYLWGIKQALREIGEDESANNFTHQALDDCKAEAKVLQFVYKSLTGQ